jgi:hypothetical protein
MAGVMRTVPEYRLDGLLDAGRRPTARLKRQNSNPTPAMRTLVITPWPAKDHGSVSAAEGMGYVAPPEAVLYDVLQLVRGE